MKNEPDLIDAFVRTREFLLREADAFPPTLRATPFVGHWNLMDVLAHLIGWDYTNIAAVHELMAGRAPEFYEHYDPGWAFYNQRLVERYGTADWQALRNALQESQTAVVTALRGLTADEFSQPLLEPGRKRPVTIAGILRAAIRDEREHLEQLRAFNASPKTRRG